jgi:hypothetical protein
MARSPAVTEEVSSHISSLASIKNWLAGSEVMAGIANINGSQQYLSNGTEVRVKGERWRDESLAFESEVCNPISIRSGCLKHFNL